MMIPDPRDVHSDLVSGNHIPYEEITCGHRIGETTSGFVILISDNGRILIRVRPGDDWFDLVTNGGNFQETSEYRYTAKVISSISRTLKSKGYDVGQVNRRTLVILGYNE